MVRYIWQPSPVCHLLAWRFQCIVCSWSWHQASEGQDSSVFLVDPTGATTTENGICSDALKPHPTDIFARLLKHIEPRPRYQDLGFAHVCRGFPTIIWKSSHSIHFKLGVLTCWVIEIYTMWNTDKCGMGVACPVDKFYSMMTSSNGNIFRVTGHLCGEIHRSPVNSPHKGQWRRALIFFYLRSINALVNDREAGDLRRHRAHYDVTLVW